MGICGADTKDGTPCQNHTSSGNCHLHTNNNLRQNAGGLFGFAPERQDFANTAGVSYGGDRDLYDTLGFPESIDFVDYWSRYTRQDIAKRIVDAAPDATWRKMPKVISKQRADEEIDEDAEKDTLHSTFKSLDNKHNILDTLRKADKLSRIGEYGLVVLGTDDVTTDEDFGKELTGNANLKYLSAFHMGDVENINIADEPTNERFGLPVEYTVDVGNESSQDSNVQNVDIHHSRVIHIAEDTLDSEIFGIPTMKPVYNLLIGMEHVIGGSQEAYWRMANRGFHLNIPDDKRIEDTDKMQDEVQAYIHDMQRFFRTRGVEMEELDGRDVDPSNIFDVLVTLITTARDDIPPKRILTGSERGELASSQDESNWFGTVAGRQKKHAGPNILRPTVNILQRIGELPEQDYVIKWPSLFELNDLEKADKAKAKASAIKSLADASLNDPDVTSRVKEQVTGIDFESDDETVNQMLDQEDEQISNQHQNGVEKNGTLS